MKATRRAVSALHRTGGRVATSVVDNGLTPAPLRAGAAADGYRAGAQRRLALPFDDRLHGGRTGSGHTRLGSRSE